MNNLPAVGWRTWILRAVAVGLAYAVAGRLAHLLATPPVYPTAVWPPAGIALAAAILWGASALPGVWLGAFAVNLSFGSAPPVAAAIALGPVLQAAAGREIARRLTGNGNPLDEGRSALRALLVTCPASCLVSASWASATLVLGGGLATSQAPIVWATWWAGDTIGVLVFTPLVLVWTARPTDLWRTRRWALTLQLLVCFVTVVLFFLYARGAAEGRARFAFEERQAAVSSDVLGDLGRMIETVQSLKSFLDASQHVDTEAFSIFTLRDLLLQPALRALSWNPVVRSGEREEFVRAARAEGLATYDIVEATAAGFQRVTDRPFQVPVLRIQPLDVNAGALGYDTYSDPIRRDAIDAAIDSGSTRVTGRIHLVQGPASVWGALVFAPVYARPSPPEGAQARRAEVRGFAVGVLDIPSQIGRSLAGSEHQGLGVRLRDLDAPGAEQELYSSWGEGTPRFSERHLWSAAGRRWELEIVELGFGVPSWSSWWVLAGGLLFTGLLGAFVVELSTRQIQVERLVEERTRALAHANLALQDSNLELQRFTHVASHDLREPLRVIVAYAQILVESASDLAPEHRRYLERMIVATSRMQTLVNDLVALARLETGAPRLVETPLADLLAIATENLDQAILESKAVIEAGELPTVRCDPSQIVQLLQNLLANAVKFRRPDTPPHVRIESRCIGPLWEISVSDNGIGIPAPHHARIFEMFERLHGREEYPGSGIGLAICRRIVERHGGTLRVYLSSSEGATFRFTLEAGVAP